MPHYDYTDIVTATNDTTMHAWTLRPPDNPDDSAPVPNTTSGAQAIHAGNFAGKKAMVTPEDTWNPGSGGPPATSPTPSGNSGTAAPSTTATADATNTPATAGSKQQAATKRWLASACFAQSDLPKVRFSSPFGWRKSTKSFHHGVDYGAPAGTPLYAVWGGTVVHAGNTHGDGYGGYGNSVAYTTPDGRKHIMYAHMVRIEKGVVRGKVLQPGELIGYVGNTGHSFGNHLHLSVRNGSGARGRSDNTNDVDPLTYFAHMATTIMKDY